MVTMNSGHMSRILKLWSEKGMTPDRSTIVLESPIFAAILDKRADLSNPEAVLAALGLPAKESRPTSREMSARLFELMGEPIEAFAKDKFVAREKFHEDTHDELPIYWLGSNFKRDFLDIVEKKVKSATLKQRKLLSSPLDSHVIFALGGESKAQVFLSYVYDFLKTADRTVPYFFYVRDVTNILRVVHASWTADKGGWRIESNSMLLWRGVRGDRVDCSNFQLYGPHILNASEEARVRARPPADDRRVVSI